MKNVLLATSILALSTGFAAAEITLSGDARMGIIDDFGPGDTAFTSRARVKFTMSGETDGGLSFGASFRADNAVGAKTGDAGEVFISGAFGKLTMGDIDGAAQQAVGNVDGVGLTGLGDLNEAIYLGAGDGLSDPTAAYEYSAGAFTGIISVTNPEAAASAYALGMKYAMGNYTFALGYESIDDAGFGVGIDHVIVGASATFGAVALKANFGRAEDDNGISADQYHVSATYTMDALSVTAFYSDEEDFLPFFGQGVGYGIGAAYDLGGGAKLVGGYAKNDTADTDAFDLGVSFSF
ncbi:porin [Tabrizicola sp.]|uniref:porin n=1 Tax=Tabrizicola sp. TaxID=2005166 RepID=UPI00286A1BFE|nr:porin [Tabrizicola sp.]